MLILARKKGEGIRIDSDIEVVVLSIHGTRVRLGVAAPDGVRIVRAELPEEGQEFREGGKRVNDK